MPRPMTVLSYLLAAFMVWMGQGLVGLAAFVTALGTLAGVYLYGSKSRKDERLRKARMMAGLPELPPPPSSAKR